MSVNNDPNNLMNVLTLLILVTLNPHNPHLPQAQAVARRVARNNAQKEAQLKMLRSVGSQPSSAQGERGFEGEQASPRKTNRGFVKPTFGLNAGKSESVAQTAKMDSSSPQAKDIRGEGGVNGCPFQHDSVSASDEDLDSGASVGLGMGSTSTQDRGRNGKQNLGSARAAQLGLGSGHFHARERIPSSKHGEDPYYFPFGNGPRSCVGRQLAMMIGQVGIALLARDFKWEYQGETLYPTQNVRQYPFDGPMCQVSFCCVFFMCFVFSCVLCIFLFVCENIICLSPCTI